MNSSRWSLSRVLALTPPGFLDQIPVSSDCNQVEVGLGQPVLETLETGRVLASVETEQWGWICIEVPPSMLPSHSG